MAVPCSRKLRAQQSGARRCRPCRRGEVGGRRVHCWGPGNDHHIGCLQVPRQGAHGLAQPPFGAVADHGATQAASDDETDTRGAIRAADEVNDQLRSALAVAVGKDMTEVGP